MVFAKLSNELFGFNTRLIQGFQGTASVMLAVERGEVDGIYSTLMTLSNDSVFTSGKLVPVVQAGRSTRHPEYPNVPLARELVSKPDDVSLLSFVESIFPVSLPFAAPPNVPQDRAKALEKAFLEACADKDFLAEAKRLNMEISPLGGEQVREVIVKMMATPPSVIQRYKRMISSK
jgi:tripartite-type tricarboxylate transporter receptor subunit TctC